jgi:hypothetical protein
MGTFSERIAGSEGNAQRPRTAMAGHVPMVAGSLAVLFLTAKWRDVNTRELTTMSAHATVDFA